jgi:enoyl-CoA hydratase/carnithine racemase
MNPMVSTSSSHRHSRTRGVRIGDRPLARRIFESNKPVIAAIRGTAVGAGSTIILPADYRIATEDSRFGYVFTRRGFFPEGGSHGSAAHGWFGARWTG